MKSDSVTHLREARLRVAVVGDVMLDRYVLGHVDRVSPEAPVPVCHVVEDRAVPGGAANVARNLAEFGNRVELVGVLGEGDAAAGELRDLCSRLLICLDGCIEDRTRPTTVKTRIIGNGQQIARIDRERNAPIGGEVEDRLAARCRGLRERADVVIVSDYAKGALTEGVVDALRDLAAAGTLVAVDPHPANRVSWHGLSVVKPNFAELVKISGVDIRDYRGGDPRASDHFRQAVEEVLRRWRPQHLLVTLGANGMYYSDATAAQQDWLPTRAAEVFDVSGAGDTSMGFFSLALAAGWSGLEAMRLANAASGIVVRKIGTASVGYEELRDAYEKI